MYTISGEIEGKTVCRVAKSRDEAERIAATYPVWTTVKITK
jgi:hypothetical protein